MSPTVQAISALWLAAEQHQEAGEPAARYTRPAYSLTPGDGDTSARPWMTDSELDQLQELNAIFSLEMRTGHDGASDRLAAKIAKRRGEAV